MGTTIWIDEDTREGLRRIQSAMGTRSVNETIQRLMARPVPDARLLFARHRAAIRSIMQRNRVKRLVAFGSRARGDAQEDSDLDLAVELRRDADPLAILATEAELEEELGIHVNLVELPNERLAKAVKQEGIAFAG